MKCDKCGNNKEQLFIDWRCYICEPKVERSEVARTQFNALYGPPIVRTLDAKIASFGSLTKPEELKAPSLLKQLSNINFNAAEMRVHAELQIPEGYVEGPTAFWKKGLDSMAVVAGDGKGNAILLHWVGNSLDQEIHNISDDPKELGLVPDEPGVFIWEGKLHSSRDYYGDYDTWLEGEFRQPSTVEWMHLSQDEEPWDRNEFVLPEFPAEEIEEEV